ncbi:L-type lectin-domain containing receptor kinase V.9 [Cardamine amara subsp. amara]|uniref:L-type lectin-domain containing receptor kinase V.9 n=1 Tax=Cardamine amara subsp. amara TaxID=228776 RepID=A0ABD1BNA2_CARAN
MNGKLSDFGLAKFCDHEIDPQTSNVDEITCGRRPVLPQASSPSEMVLTDWVLGCWEDDILQVVDDRIKHDDRYLEEQVTLVLTLGLLCSHPVAATRPCMSSVIQLLDGVVQLPNILWLSYLTTCLTLSKLEKMLESLKASVKQLSLLRSCFTL